MSHATRLGLGGLAAAVLALAVLPVAAAGAQVASGSPEASGATVAVSHPNSQPEPLVAITKVSPPIAQPATTVTVSGVVINPTASRVTGLSVQLQSSGTALPNRHVMAEYVSPSGAAAPGAPVGPVHLLPPLAPHATRQWVLRLRTSQLGMHTFGVYPLAAQLSGGQGTVSTARSFLPFWPRKPYRRALKRLSIAWIWPLIDAPQHAACQALASDALAAKLSGHGRLATLLAAGQSATGRRAHLTWAIDPALLADVQLMTTRYRVGAGSGCAGGQTMPASQAAQAWLAGVRTVTSQQGFFVTPYADVDVAALAHAGLDTGGGLASAFGAGRSVAHRILGHTQRTAPQLAGSLAWPPDGIADFSVLEELARNKVRTVILDSNLMRPRAPLSYTPGAVTSTPVLTTRLRVLLADHTLTRVLAAPRARVTGVIPAQPSAAGTPALQQAAAFATEQRFLAETAMIVAGNPGLARSIVVTPPRRWSPPPGTASALLSGTLAAPWLRPVSLASLATAARAQGNVPRHSPPGKQKRAGELRPAVLVPVRNLTGRIRLLGSILARGGHGYLSTAVAAIESSAWRGSRADQRRALHLLHAVSAYATAHLKEIQLIGPVHVTLGGQSGAIPVSIRNQLQQPVQVRLTVSAPSKDRVTIGAIPSPIIVNAGKLDTVKIRVRASAAGSITLTLRLTTPLPQAKPLPGQTVTLTVQATHFGTLAIIIIVVALVLFVLTAAARAIRRGSDPAGDGAPGGAAGGEGGPPETPASAAEPATGGSRPDSVVSQGANDPH